MFLQLNDQSGRAEHVEINNNLQNENLPLDTTDISASDHKNSFVYLMVYCQIVQLIGSSFTKLQIQIEYKMVFNLFHVYL